MAKIWLKERFTIQRNLFKLFLNDVGLLASCYASEFQLQIITGETNINFGGIFENFVAQELKAHGYGLHYFNSKAQGELDFVVEHDDKVIPIEVKSGKDYKRHNALSNVMANKDYGIQQGIVLSSGNMEQQDKVCYIPIYMVMYLKPVEMLQPVFAFHPMWWGNYSPPEYLNPQFRFINSGTVVPAKRAFCVR